MTGTPFQGTDLEFPAGTVLPYDGKLSDVPAGWAYCDGNNGTPDLRNRTMKCVPTASTDAGGTGGQNSLTLTENQMASHSHTGGTSSSDGDHNHSIMGFDNYGADVQATNSGILPQQSGGGSFTINSAGDHNHSWGIGTSGGDGQIDNRPPTMRMGFIKKL